MTQWSTTTKHEPSSINGGRRYELRDRVSIEQLNYMTENGFYAMAAASEAKEKAEEALSFAQGSGTTVFEGGKPVAEFNADKKVNQEQLNNYYTKEQVDELVENGGSADVDLTNYYTKDETYSKQEIDDKLANLDVDIDFSDYYTKQQTDSLLSNKADKTEIPKDYLPNTIKYGSSIDLSIDSTTYVVTAQLKDQDGNNLGTSKTIDLPLESVVVSGSYDAINKKVILTLKDGSTIDFSVADLVNGLASSQDLELKVNIDASNLTNENVANWKAKLGYTTMEEVEAKKYATISAVNTALSSKANQSSLDKTNTDVERLSTNKADKTELENYVTTEALEGKGYLTEVPSEYVTETELTSKNYATKGLVDSVKTQASNAEAMARSNRSDITELQGRVSTLETAGGGGSKLYWREWT